jgi:hypothetical protein
MRAWTLVIAAMLSVAGVAFDSALSQEAFSELQWVDRALVRICEARKDRLDDREQAMWRRRRELVDALDEAQRAQLRRTSPLDEACLQLIGRLAEARRPQFSGYAHRRYYRPGGEGPQPSMEPRASPQARMGPPPVPQNAPPPPTVAPAPSAGDRPLEQLFPWPPPTPSTRRSFSPDVIEGAARVRKVGDVASRLEQIMRSAAFDAFGYYRVPGGFALITRIESLDGESGAPLAGAARWGARATYAGLSLSSIFATTRASGFYRVFVFLLTDDPPMTQAVDSAQAFAIAQTWAIEGRPSLPAEIKVLPIGQNHVLVVMVYEFEKVDGGETKHFRPSRWPLDQHLSTLGVSLKQLQ